MTPTQTMHYHSGKSSRLPYIWIFWSTQNSWQPLGPLLKVKLLVGYRHCLRRAQIYHGSPFMTPDWENFPFLTKVKSQQTSHQVEVPGLLRWELGSWTQSAAEHPPRPLGMNSRLKNGSSSSHLGSTGSKCWDQRWSLGSVGYTPWNEQHLPLKIEAWKRKFLLIGNHHF